MGIFVSLEIIKTFKNSEEAWNFCTTKKYLCVVKKNYGMYDVLKINKIDKFSLQYMVGIYKIEQKINLENFENKLKKIKNIILKIKKEIDYYTIKISIKKKFLEFSSEKEANDFCMNSGKLYIVTKEKNGKFGIEELSNIKDDNKIIGMQDNHFVY